MKHGQASHRLSCSVPTVLVKSKLVNYPSKNISLTQVSICCTKLVACVRTPGLEANCKLRNGTWKKIPLITILLPLIGTANLKS